MKRTLVVVLYTFGVGLALQGWLSKILPLSWKLLLTLAALLVIGTGFALQWKWRVTDE